MSGGGGEGASHMCSDHELGNAAMRFDLRACDAM